MHQATDLADNMMCIFIYTRVLVLLKKVCLPRMVFSVYLALVSMRGQTAMLRQEMLKLYQGFLWIKCKHE